MASECNAASEQVCALPGDAIGDFEEIDFNEALSYTSYMSAAHAMYYAFTDRMLFNEYRQSAHILMQMRFDGKLGFPGGLVDPTDATPVEGLNRELVEEMNIDLGGGNTIAELDQTGCLSQQLKPDQSSNHSQPLKQDQTGHSNSSKPDETSIEPAVTGCCLIKQTDHTISHVNHKKKLITHFYSKEITKREFARMERKALDAKDWGTENLGNVRVPLYSLHRDNLSGLPVFLANQFAGNAREQLLLTIQRKRILEEAELKKMIDSYKNRYTRNGKQ